MEPLERWIDRQYRHSAKAMLKSVSPTAIVKTRPGFDQTIVPVKGSIVASPVLGAYDPEPDYFFHWYRDSAVVVDALRLLAEDEEFAGDDGFLLNAPAHIADFVRFSLSLQGLDGRALVDSSGWRSRVAPDFAKYLRSDADLAAVDGETVAAETRVNPDGTLDISSWPRPQHDGPAMRAIALLRWSDSPRFPAELKSEADTLLRSDLSHTLEHWRDSCFDIWEEEKGLHYYTLRIAAAALDRGADWLAREGHADGARACRADASTILGLLDGYWLEDGQYYRSRVLDSGARSSKELDIAVILAAVHAAGSGETHSVHDPRMRATLARLEALFDAEYPINRDRSAARAPAMGRYAGDVYYSGGAYYFSTLAAAEFCFRAAAGADDATWLISHGDAFLETVRAYAPTGGALSEQFDQQTGVPRSAQQLAWSHAAFISSIAARRFVSR